jgi:hypothetical protein
MDSLNSNLIISNNLDSNIDSTSSLSFQSNPDIYCCVCFNDSPFLLDNNTNIILSLNDIETNFFDNNIIPDELLILSACNVHYLCISCMRKIINNYENHPINENNSHFFCPYPFASCETSIGFKNIFDHHLIKKICKTDIEWQNYINYANQYMFPGFTIIYCPFRCSRNREICNSLILVENDILKNTPIGEMIIECTQNINCLKKFCYYCKSSINVYSSICYDCKLCYENENPNTYNYYINKIQSLSEPFDSNSSSDNSEIISTEILKFDESEYLYKNSELTVDIVLSHINNIIENIDIYMICPICKISVYKTEKCNGLSHHGIERCYACGRIGFKIKGLGEHWSVSGIEGCFRFDYESFVKENIPEYICYDSVCHNHDKGDCSIESHQPGIIKLIHTRKIAYIYHLLKSIPSHLRDQIYDVIYQQYSNIPTYLEFIPYKQTFVLINKFKKRSRDYTENIVYTQLQCIHPSELTQFTSKFHTIDADSYISDFSIEKTDSNESNDSINRLHQPLDMRFTDVSAWRSYIVNPQIQNTQNTFENLDTENYEYDFTSITRPLLQYIDNHSIDITEANNTTPNFPSNIPSTIQSPFDLNQDDIINIYSTYYNTNNTTNNTLNTITTNTQTNNNNNQHTSVIDFSNYEYVFLSDNEENDE